MVLAISTERDKSMPVWRQLESAIAADIASGVFRPGVRLPSAQELAERFGVNRHTARRALGELETRGVIRTEKGSGSFVREQPYPYPISQRTRFMQAMTSLSVETRHETVTLRTEDTPRHVAEALGAQVRRVHRVEYVSWAEDRPVDFGIAWFPAARFPGLLQVFERLCSVTRTLAEFGVHDYTRQYTSVMAKLPSSAVAKHLRQSTRRPVLFARSLNVDLDNVPVQYGETMFAGDWIQLEMRHT